MAGAKGLERAIRLTGFFNIKKMAADFCSAQCIIDNTGSLRIISGDGGERSTFSSYEISTDLKMKHA